MMPIEPQAVCSAGTPSRIDGSVPTPVIRLRPVHTLVIAHDLAFRRRASMVLAELGCVSLANVALDAIGKIVILARRQRADVVVLDATGAIASVGPVVSALYDMAPRVGVLVVMDQVHCAVGGLRVIPREGPDANLSAAVTNASRLGSPLREER
jgi:hypothetical protein